MTLADVPKTTCNMEIILCFHTIWLYKEAKWHVGSKKMWTMLINHSLYHIQYRTMFTDVTEYLFTICALCLGWELKKNLFRTIIIIHIKQKSFNYGTYRPNENIWNIMHQESFRKTITGYNEHPVLLVIMYNLRQLNGWGARQRLPVHCTIN